jgi:hypothetical protein
MMKMLASAIEDQVKVTMISGTMLSKCAHHLPIMRVSPVRG